MLSYRRRSYGACRYRIAAAGAIFLLSVATASFRVYPDHPLPGHTGGFGEPTCHTCHFDNDINDPSGWASIEGLPGRYEPGASYELAVRVFHPDLGSAGFQMSARISSDQRFGEHAGAFEATSTTASVTEAGDRSVQYIHHTAEGSQWSPADTAAWSFNWTAPSEGDAAISFNLTANAANGDHSEFGDFIYAVDKQIEVRR